MIAMTKYKLKESVIYQEVGEEALLLDGKTEEVFSLNAVARDIWLAVQRTNSLDAAVAELILLYKVDASIFVATQRPFSSPSGKPVRSNNCWHSGGSFAIANRS